MRDAILEPAIGRDLARARAGAHGRRLLRQVFGVAAPSARPGPVALAKIQGQLQDPGALETIAHYLALLEEAFLVAALPKHAVASRRGSARPRRSWSR